MLFRMLKSMCKDNDFFRCPHPPHRVTARKKSHSQILTLFMHTKTLVRVFYNWSFRFKRLQILNKRLNFAASKSSGIHGVFLH